MGKLQLISQLADQTAHAVTRDVDGWKRYLTTASRLYKYSFDEQLLIYAQRPDATACAEMELWNNTMHRWVKAGSKGIAVIRQNGGRPRLEYVFDVADTRPVRGARTPWLWEMREDYHDQVLAAFERRYGETQGADFGDRLMEAAASAVREVYRDHLTELAYDAQESLLEGLDDLNLEVRFRSLLTASVQYTLLTRCGLDPAAYLEDSDFSGITEFSTPAVLHHLGSAASSISREMLLQVASAIRTEEREQAKKGRKKEENPLAKPEVIRYTKGEGRFNTVKRESEERSGQDDSNIHEERRLPGSRPDAGRDRETGGDAPGQIRDAAADLPSGTPQRDIHLHAADRQTGTPSEGDRPAGTGTDRPNGRRNNEAGGGNGSGEGQRPHGLGAEGERPDRPGGGNRAGGDRLQVNKDSRQAAGDEPAASASREPAYRQFALFPTVEEQVEAIAQSRTEDRMAPKTSTAPVLGVPPAVVGRALTSGGNKSHSQERIVAFFQKNPTGSAAASFLEKEYGEGGKGLSIGGREYALWFDKEGIRIAPGRTAHAPDSTLVPWGNAAAQMRELLRDGVFASQEVIDRAQDNEFREVAEKLWYLRQNFSDQAREQGFLPTIDALYGGFSESTAKITEQLRDPSAHRVILAELSRLTEAYGKDNSLLRFRTPAPSKDLLIQVNNLAVPPELFAAIPDFAPAKGTFVTQDEIDRMLRGGGNVAGNKLKIYSYFMQGHNAKECADFLKDSYGIGGQGHLGYDEWHDAKGIRLTRSDDFSGWKGYDTVKLNWNQVQKRIRELMDAGQYLSRREAAHLPEYEKLQLAQEIYAFQYSSPNDPGRTYPHEWDFTAGGKQIRPLLDDLEKCAALYGEMVQTMAAVPPDYQHYDSMKRALDDMAAYQRGEYSLFTPLPEYALESERQKKQEAKQEAKQPRQKKEPEGELAAAARRLAKKRNPAAMETPEGQLTLDLFMGSPAQAEPEDSPPEAPEAEEASDFKDVYRLLSRLKEDCDYFLGAGERQEKHLWAGNAAAQLDKMRELYALVPEKPEWLTEQELSDYAQRMAPPPVQQEQTAPSLTVRELFDQYLPLVKDRVLEDTAYQNACKNSDQENAQIEAQAAIKRAALSIDSLNFQRLYHDHTTFHNRLHQQIWEETYPVLAQPQEATVPAPDAEKSPVTLYRETLALVADAVRDSSLYAYLRDRDTDIDDAKDELDSAISDYMADIAEEYPELTDAYLSLPMFREWLTEDILERYYQDYTVDKRDMVDKSADDPDAPDWAKGDHAVPAADSLMAENSPSHDRIPPQKRQPSEHTGAGAFQNQKSPEQAQVFTTVAQNNRAVTVTEAEFSILQGQLDNKAVPYAVFHHRSQDSVEISFSPEDESTVMTLLRQMEEKAAEPDLTPNVEEYLNLKAQHPDKLVGVQVDGHILFYGKDAQEAARAMGTNLLTREIPGLGETGVTSSRLAWQAVLKKLLEHGNSVVLAWPDPAGGYAIIKERDIADFIPLGMELTIDGRRMKVDRVNYDAGTVSLQDMEMQSWYPIFRQEPVSFVRQFVEEAQLAQPQPPIAESSIEQLSPEPVEIDGGRVTAPAPSFTYQETGRVNAGAFEVVFQELHTGPECRNFQITDDHLGEGGQKTKYQYNVAAIHTLKQIEAEGRLALPEEQEILSKYVGWGGLADAFDPSKDNWAKEYAQLKELLAPEEYESAQSTVLNAHYTSPTVIKAIYDAVGQMNFTPGNVLEPSCGIGNFFGLAPAQLADAKLYGVELDSLTGRIARQLYQKADITIDGFERTDYPDDFFDLAVGNVPFGEYHVHDPRYNRQNLLIHDYFLTKTLDKVRPGGIVAFITTKGTMDKKSSKVREALAQKADLLGAIRLPNNAFKANAGTEVTADILFFQKRDRIPEKLPDWVEVGQTEDGVPLNRYFLQHPEMVLGEMQFWRNMYGNETETACLPIPGADLAEQLAEAVRQIDPPSRELLALNAPEQETTEESIPADPSVRNFSYALSKGKLYFRENSQMKRVEMGKTQTERVKGMIAIRDCARELIDLQLQNASDGDISVQQTKLNTLYDQFTKKYGIINSAGNRQAFRQDSSYPLLCSLEVLDDEKQFQRKADMFHKRTIQHRQPVTSVDTAAEALAVSIGERACVDLGFMASLMGGSDKIPQIVKDLQGVIFKDPDTGPFDLESGGTDWHRGWQTADEYLSGDVRRKLETARAAAQKNPEFDANVAALEQVQPKDLTAAEIDVRIGADWIPTKYYQQFMFELFQTPYQYRNSGARGIRVLHSKTSGEWSIQNKNADSASNTRVWKTYGTKRCNAYVIFENALNLRDTRIYDTTYEDGKEKRVLNPKETAIAQQKQEAISEAFREWIFKDPDRRAELCAAYNRIFNSIRPRTYDGQHISFVGMNPEIRLETHQRNAVARMLYGGNTLLAHCVGAGKTFEMTAAAMESKRLGLCQKSLFVVPNHLTEQWGGDFLTLYPGAKVLVATKRDFEPQNRRKFCARIATGDYDAVVIGHSQFEKIPLSPDRQQAVMEAQRDEIIDAISEAKANREERFTIKQLERMKKNLDAKLQKLHDKKKDDTVTFEELGVDRLFVDEAHSYKNLFLHTKMQNVAGISQTEAQKSSDMFAKCRYLDEITGGRGVTFATGTPVSNSMVELYTMMRYLQFDLLEQKGLRHFDSWAAAFGEKVTAVELKPEGTGFRAKTRFARFFNLPELMSMWREAADIQTADMLKLPVPEAEYITIQTEPSEAQKQMVQELGQRAEEVRGGGIDPSRDNMLKITSDGRKLALDQRIVNPLLPDDPGSKVNACVANVFQVWQDSAGIKGAQLVFCDLSTPKGKPAKQDSPEKEETSSQTTEDTVDVETVRLETSVYEDIRDKLIAKGIPAHEIAFIHSANTEAQKAELFAKVRSGQVRVLLGSTQKMGAGTNVQTRLVASHDLDCPWRPADLEQRAGRIVRRGNLNEKLKIYRYVTKGTFDAYNWGLVENKQKFIGQIMTSKSPARSIEDVDATALSYAEVKMLATGDPRIKEKMDLDIQVAKLKMLKANHQAQQYETQDSIVKYYPQQIAQTQLMIDVLSGDLPVLEAHPVKEDSFSMTIQGKVYTERKAAGEAIVAACKSMTDPEKPIELGEYRGFAMRLALRAGSFQVSLKHRMTYTAELSEDIVGNITRINNALERIPKNLEANKQHLATLHTQLETAKEEAGRPFPLEEELTVKAARLSQLNTELDNDGRGSAPSQEDGEAPGREDGDEPGAPDEKPSIRQALRQYERPAPVSTGIEKRQEAVL